MQLDHAVINTRYNLDAAEQRFEALGFQLTARGYHSLGSTNHLMMFGTDYLELIGLPEPLPGSDQPRVTRAGVSDAPVGINGLVFKTDDAEATFAHLQALGMAGEPPKSFSRPVDLHDGEAPREASFTTVHVRPDCFPAGRVYFCQHHTPELVWRPAWQRHANGSTRIAALLLVSTEPEREAEQFAKLMAGSARAVGAGEFSVAATDFCLDVVSPAQYQQRFGDYASPTQARNSFFGALRIAVDDPAKVMRFADKLPASTWSKTSASSVVVREASFDTLLEFVAPHP